MKVFISYMNDCMPCVNTVIRDLKKAGHSVIAKERTRMKSSEISKSDIVIVIAGDGTFLKTAHHVDAQPMIGVNSTPDRRLGFYCRATPESVIEKITKWEKGKLKPIKLMRLESEITHKGKTIKPFLTLNELFIGCLQPYHVSKYWISLHGKREYQKSSGFLVSTPSGSHAWNYTAGGKRIKITDRKILFVTREAVHSRIVKMKMTKGILAPNQTIEIQSEMDDGIIAIDSFPKPWSFIKGDKIKIKASHKELNFIS